MTKAAYTYKKLQCHSEGVFDRRTCVFALQPRCEGSLTLRPQYHRRVGAAAGEAAREDLEHVVHRQFRHPNPGRVARAPDMRRHDHMGELQQRMVGANWLDFGDIESGAGDSAVRYTTISISRPALASVGIGRPFSRRSTT